MMETSKDTGKDEPVTADGCKTVDEYRSILQQISAVMERIAVHKDRLAREALEGRCACGAAVRTAEWVTLMSQTEPPIRERLQCQCATGHRWYWPFEQTGG